MSKGNLDAFKSNNKTVEIDTSKKVRIGIIGTGGIANAHMREYLKMPDVEIISCADIVPKKAEEYAKRHGLDIKCYNSHAELIDAGGIDAVSICTYNSTHAECAIYAMENGVDVLLEKPMCVTLEEAVAICKAEKKSGRILSVGFQPRYDNNMKMVKQIVQSGVLGEIYYIQTGGGRRHGIPAYHTSFIESDKGVMGALADIGCYSLDMVLNSIGYPKPLTVSGFVSDFFGKDPDYYKSCNYVNPGEEQKYADLFGVDDFGAAFIRLEGGIVIDFRIAWAMHLDSPGDTIIMGKKGSLRIPATDCWNGSVGGNLKLYQRIAGKDVVTEFPMLPPLSEGCFYYKVRSFLDAVKNRTQSPISSREILINQAIIDGINKSAKQGGEIEIHIPEI